MIKFQRLVTAGFLVFSFTAASQEAAIASTEGKSRLKHAVRIAALPAKKCWHVTKKGAHKVNQGVLWCSRKVEPYTPLLNAAGSVAQIGTSATLPVVRH